MNATEDLSKLSKEQLMERLKKEQQRQEEALTLKVSEKGAVSLYGIRRFPVTFYGSEWETIFNQREKIEAFIRDNRRHLKGKN